MGLSHAFRATLFTAPNSNQSCPFIKSIDLKDDSCPRTPRLSPPYSHGGLRVFSRIGPIGPEGYDGPMIVSWFMALVFGAGMTFAPDRAVPAALEQVAPSSAETNTYTGLLAGAAKGDTPAIERLLNGGANPNVRDANGRTPLIVAAHFSQYEAVRVLLKGGADPNALDNQRYDLITVAAVQDDARMIQIGLQGGASASTITSPYGGTALIAAAHLGNVAAVRELTAARAPLDHVNNLGWTALLEAIILGDGGARHTQTVRLLVEAGANVNIPDRGGMTPLGHAIRRGYARIVSILQQVGANR